MVSEHSVQMVESDAGSGSVRQEPSGDNGAYLGSMDHVIGLQQDLQSLQNQYHRLTHDQLGNLLPRIDLFRGGKREEIELLQGAIASVKRDIDQFRPDHAQRHPSSAPQHHAHRSHAPVKLPANLPQWVRKGKDAIGILTFIEDYENKLTANAIPRERWPAALLACVPNDAASFI